jgi:hypothetical protein
MPGRSFRPKTQKTPPLTGFFLLPATALLAKIMKFTYFK